MLNRIYPMKFHYTYRLCIYVLVFFLNVGGLELLISVLEMWGS
jgi:hypothetical protein